MKPRNVLCIDNEDTCRLYELMFSNFKNRVRLISPKDMKQAIDFVKSRTIDLYILECWHPEIDGLELCRIIRQTDSKTPIVFYSSLSREKDRSLAFAAGADAYFVKASD